MTINPKVEHRKTAHVQDPKAVCLSRFEWESSIFIEPDS